jgi:hypothetical protein
LGRLADDVQRDDVRPTAADDGGERTQLARLIGNVDVQPP